MKSRRSVFSRPRRRRPWIWICLLLAGMATAAWGLFPLRDPSAASGLGQEVTYLPIDKLPPWARQVVRGQGIAPDYQLVAALVDLNRDERVEILVAPAPPRPDLFIPDVDLYVVQFGEAAWSASSAAISCRPSQLGSFMTEGYWDLRCRDGRGRHLLRWNGEEYR